MTGDGDFLEFFCKGHLREEDIEESFIRSAGPGGQNVNKVATCVLLVHRPTGVRVKCQKCRLQGQNRVLARAMLLAEVKRRAIAFQAARIAARERIRRRDRPKPAGLKQRILESKKKHSRKKQARRKSFSADSF